MSTANYSAQTVSEFDRVSAEDGEIWLDGLAESERKASPSNWTRRHLVAYRLLIQPITGFLDLFREDHDAHCPVCVELNGADEDHMSPQVINQHYVDALTGNWPNASDLLRSTDSQLLQATGGFYWIALARASRSVVPMPVRGPGSRNRVPVIQTCFENTVEVVEGSSSPIRTSASEFEESFAESIDPDEHETRQSIPEEVTVHLIISFLQFVLQLCLVQDPESQQEVRPRVDRRRSALPYLGSGETTAEDDGGICMMNLKPEGWIPEGWIPDNSYLALIEAKRAFKRFEYDGATGRMVPKPSDKTIAQYLGEAIATWSSDRGEVGDK